MSEGFKVLEKYFNKAESNSIQFQGDCHDCNKPVVVDIDKIPDGHDKSQLVINGGAVYFEDDTFFMKCDPCFKKDSTLRNFRKCDVYSRVVGFYRPIKSWNDGKRSEWRNHKDYNLPADKELAA